MAAQLLARHGMRVDLTALPVLQVSPAEYSQHLNLHHLSELGLSKGEYGLGKVWVPPTFNLEAVFLPTPTRRVIVFHSGEQPLSRDALDCMLLHELVHAWQDQQNPEIYSTLGALKRDVLRSELRLGSNHPEVRRVRRKVHSLLTFLEGHALLVEEQLRERYYPGVESPGYGRGRRHSDLADVQSRYAHGRQVVADAFESPGLLAKLLQDPERAIAWVDDKHF